MESFLLEIGVQEFIRIESLKGGYFRGDFGGEEILSLLMS
jgi:hypothetical protein